MVGCSSARNGPVRSLAGCIVDVNCAVKRHRRTQLFQDGHCMVRQLNSMASLCLGELWPDLCGCAECKLRGRPPMRKKIPPPSAAVLIDVRAVSFSLEARQTPLSRPSVDGGNARSVFITDLISRQSDRPAVTRTPLFRTLSSVQVRGHTHNTYCTHSTMCHLSCV